MRVAGDGVHGARIRALAVILWRAGLQINEALTLAETDLEPRQGSILVRHGKGGKRREVGMDDWAWDHVEPWRQRRLEMPVAPFFSVVRARPVAGRGHKPARAPSCDDSRRWPVYAAGSRRINSVTRTR